MNTNLRHQGKKSQPGRAAMVTFLFGEMQAVWCILWFSSFGAVFSKIVCCLRLHLQKKRGQERGELFCQIMWKRCGQTDISCWLKLMICLFRTLFFILYYNLHSQSHENMWSRCFILLGFALEGGIDVSLMAIFNTHIRDTGQKGTGKSSWHLRHQWLPLCGYTNTRWCSWLIRASLFSSCSFFWRNSTGFNMHFNVKTSNLP